MQYIFWNWQDNDSTKDLNHRFLGPLEPGRYKGFAGDVNTPGGMTLRLENETTGTEFTLFDAAHSVEKRGVLFTKQGVMIQESGNIDLPIAPNNTTSSRIDLIVCEHEYVDTQNGSNAIYYVIQGVPSATPVPPVLTAPGQIKLVLGQLYLPPGTTDLQDSDVLYTPTPSPYFNDTAGKLVDLTDIFLQNPGNDVPVDHMIISTGGGEFEDDDIHNIIRHRNFKLAKTFELGQSSITDFTGLITNISTSGPVKNGLIIDASYKNTILLSTITPIVIDALPDTFQNGTKLTFIVNYGDVTFNTNSIVNTGPTVSGWRELKDVHQATNTQTNTITLSSDGATKKVIMAYKHQDYWLLMQPAQEIDFDLPSWQIGGIKNKPYIAPFTQNGTFEGRLLNVLLGGTISSTGAITSFTGYDNSTVLFTVTKPATGIYHITIDPGVTGPAGFDKDNYLDVGVLVTSNGAFSIAESYNIGTSGGYVNLIQVHMRITTSGNYYDNPFSFLVFKTN